MESPAPRVLAAVIGLLIATSTVTAVNAADAGVDVEDPHDADDPCWTHDQKRIQALEELHRSHETARNELEEAQRQDWDDLEADWNAIDDAWDEIDDDWDAIDDAWQALDDQWRALDEAWIELENANLSEEERANRTQELEDRREDLHRQEQEIQQDEEQLLQREQEIRERERVLDDRRRALEEEHDTQWLELSHRFRDETLAFLDDHPDLPECTPPDGAGCTLGANERAWVEFDADEEQALHEFEASMREKRAAFEQEMEAKRAAFEDEMDAAWDAFGSSNHTEEERIAFEEEQHAKRDAFEQEQDEAWRAFDEDERAARHAFDAEMEEKRRAFEEEMRARCEPVDHAPEPREPPNHPDEPPAEPHEDPPDQDHRVPDLPSMPPEDLPPIPADAPPCAFEIKDVVEEAMARHRERAQRIEEQLDRGEITSDEARDAFERLEEERVELEDEIRDRAEACMEEAGFDEPPMEERIGTWTLTWDPDTDVGTLEGTYVRLVGDPTENVLEDVEVQGDLFFSLIAPETRFEEDCFEMDDPGEGSRLSGCGDGVEFELYDSPVGLMRFWADACIELTVADGVDVVQVDDGLELDATDSRGLIVGDVTWDPRTRIASVCDGHATFRVPDAPAPVAREAADRHSDAIEQAHREHTVGAEVNVGVEATGDAVKEVLPYEDVDVDVEASTGTRTVALTVDAELDEGKTFIVNVDRDLIGDTGQVRVRHHVVDDATGDETEKAITQASGLEDVLDPSDDDGAEYVVVLGRDGAQLLVSIPHFSIHKVTIQDAGARTPLPLPEIDLRSPGVAAVIGTVSLVAYGWLRLRRR